MTNVSNITESDNEAGILAGTFTIGVQLPAPAQIPHQDELTLCGPSGDNNWPRDVARLYLSEDGVVSVQIDYEWTQNPGMSESVWSGRTKRWRLPDNVDRDALIDALSEDGQITRCLVDFVGGDADIHAIETLLMDLPQSDQAAWLADEWLYGSMSYAAALAALNLNVDATEAQIAAAAAEAVSGARADKALIRGGDGAMADAIKAAIERERENLAAAAEI